MVSALDSILPALSPLFGIAFALNLAYIGLPRFRYREQIRDYAVTTLNRFDGGEEVPEKFRKTDLYAALHRMSTLDGAKSTQRNFPQPAKNANGKETEEANGKNKRRTKPEKWIRTFGFWFEGHWDRRLVIVASVLPVILIALGSAHTAGRYEKIFGLSFMNLFSNESFTFWFIFSIVLCLTPCFFVWRGGNMVDDAKESVEERVNDALLMMQEEAKEVPAPD